MQNGAFINRVQKYITKLPMVVFCLLFCASLLSACSSQSGTVKNVSRATPGESAGSLATDADKFLIVDCLLPGQIRKLGKSMTYLSPRRAVKTTANECEIRGGEYIAYDRGNMATALSVWLPQAKEGDKQAQTYVGEIYEKGMGGMQPDYKLAAQWYEKAADQGYTRAQINLGYLYERGLGVPKNSLKALNLYREASGIKQELSIGPVQLGADEKAELTGLRDEVKRSQAETQALQKELSQTRRELDKARSQLQQRRERVQIEESKLEKARKDYENLKEKTAGSDFARLQSREESIEKLEARLAKERKEIERKRKELDRVESAQTDPAKELEKAQRQLSERKAALDAERKRFEQERQEFEKRKQELAQSVPPEVKKKEEALNKREEEIVGLRQEVEEQRQKIAKLESAGQSPAEDFAKLHRQLDERNTAIDAEKARLEKERQELERQKQELAQTVNPELERKEEALNQREQEIAGLRQEVEQQKQEIARLEEASKGSAENFEKLQQQLNERKSAVEAERERLEKERQEIEQQKQKLAQTVVPELKEKEEALKKHEQEVARLRDELEQKQQEIAKLEEVAESSDILLSQSDLLPVTPSTASSGGPVIEILDPQLVLTRGVRIAPTNPSASSRNIVGKVTAPAGLLTLTVNDREQQVDSSGLFQVEMPVMRSAETPVKIVAVDKLGNRATVDFALVADQSQAASMTASAGESDVPAEAKKLPPIDFGPYYALVIGNNDYTHLPKLDTAVNDAQSVASVLSSKYGFKTTVLTNATRYDILGALNNLRKQLTEKDNLLIYYAGHGDLDKANLRGYWLPVDAEPGNTANWISVVDITDILNAMSAEHILVIADSCYSGVMTRSALTNLEAGMSDEARYNWLKVMAEKRSRTVLTSGGMQPVLDAGGGGHSIFAKALLKVLKSNKDILEGQRLGREVSTLVSYAAKAYVLEQVPEYSPIRYAGHESGDFFFVPKT